MKKVTMILVGGFLGAGKTTLMTRVAKHFAGQGQRVGLITNDQATDLVDTGLIRREGLGVGEVAGGCFCCRFNDLVNAAQTLLTEMQPDILLGEPVGSCTDLAATVIRPLQALYAEWFQMAPFTVLTDPGRLREAVIDGVPSAFPENVRYIFHKQLEEADLIAVNKLDLLSPTGARELQDAVARRFPGTRVLGMSAQTGQGVDEWLRHVLTLPSVAGRHEIPINYDAYAEGEAVLGWLNASVSLEADQPADWVAFVHRTVERLHRALRERGAEIAHLKLLLTTPAGALVTNLTSTAGEPTYRGGVTRPTTGANLVVNARVSLAPADLQTAVESSLQATADAGHRAQVLQIQSFRPGRPKPTHHLGGQADAL